MSPQWFNPTGEGRPNGGPLAPLLPEDCLEIRGGAPPGCASTPPHALSRPVLPVPLPFPKPPRPMPFPFPKPQPGPFPNPMPSPYPR
jgi:hypothetical protein